MSDVKRYDVRRSGLHADDELSSSRGVDKVVLHSDYDALLAENERMHKEKAARQALSIQLIDEARNLRAELGALRQPVADEREAFRSIAAAHKVEGGGFDLTQLPNGSFINNETRLMYEGWKLARAALSAPAAGQSVPLTTGQILALERRARMSDDEAIRYARTVEALISRNTAPTAAGQDVSALVEALEKIAADDYDAPPYAPDRQIKNNLSQAFCRMRWTARHALAAHKAGGGKS